MSFLMDMWHAVQGIVMSSDWITLVIMAVIALGAGFLIHQLSSLPTATVVALLAFGLASYARGVLLGKQNAAAFASQDWQAFLNLQMKILLPYFLIFLVAIGIAHALRMVTLGRG
ncbi:MAG: hypothetical protein ISS15_10565 [Alphaproteobacteria bacterium]|nr:hypothetical protein [Alphaproteobacteria bacterium]MBL7098091.1 hypothetical protein [Alphaproteobacteria bacterium]